MYNNVSYRIDGLTSDLKEIFEQVSSLECIKGLYLCGGTAQSIQMGHRLSEDLDFELLGIRKERPSLDFGGIIDEIQKVFPQSKPDILGSDHFQIFIGERKAKLSFFRPENPVKYIHEGIRYNNIITPSLQDLLGMKLYTICLRTKSRDFYDIYCLLENGCSLKEGISYASALSRHTFKSKSMLGKLLNPMMYPINDEFLKLRPRYDVTSELMQARFQKAIFDDMSCQVGPLDSVKINPARTQQETIEGNDETITDKSKSYPFDVNSSDLPGDFSDHIELIGRYDGMVELPDGTVGAVQKIGDELRFQDSGSIAEAIRQTNLIDGDGSQAFVVDGKTYALKDPLERYLDILPYGKGAWVKDGDGEEVYLAFSIERQRLIPSISYEDARKEVIKRRKEGMEEPSAKKKSNRRSKGKTS